MTPPDAIDAAIAATQAPQTVQMVQTQIQLPPQGRPAAILVPQDITADEGYYLLTAIAEIVKQVRLQNPMTRLVTPNGAPLG